MEQAFRENTLCLDVKYHSPINIAAPIYRHPHPHRSVSSGATSQDLHACSTNKRIIESFSRRLINLAYRCDDARVTIDYRRAEGKRHRIRSVSVPIPPPCCHWIELSFHKLGNTSGASYDPVRFRFSRNWRSRSLVASRLRCRFAPDGQSATCVPEPLMPGVRADCVDGGLAVALRSHWTSGRTLNWRFVLYPMRPFPRATYPQMRNVLLSGPLVAYLLGRNDFAGPWFEPRGPVSMSCGWYRPEKISGGYVLPTRYALLRAPTLPRLSRCCQTLYVLITSAWICRVSPFLFLAEITIQF